jgi:hypothetical protein
LFNRGKPPGGEVSTIATDGNVAMPTLLDVLNGEDLPPIEFLTNIIQQFDRLTTSTAFGLPTLEVILTDMLLDRADALALPVTVMAPCSNV